MNLPETAGKQKNLILYFQVHQPRRLRTLRFFDIGGNRGYFDDELNREIIQRIATNCYLPANALLLKLIRKYPDIRVAFSISGITIDQLEESAPEVLDSFRALAETGSVEFLGETYYHSLAAVLPENEFEQQVVKHQEKIRRHFGVLPKFFRNTELIYSNELGERIEQLGFKGVFIDGVDRILQGQSVHHVYAHPSVQQLKILLRDYRLSDDIAFRFCSKSSTLTAPAYIQWLRAIPDHENVVTLAMDYETFGEHQKKETGIFTFLEGVLTTLSKDKTFRFTTPSEATGYLSDAGALSVPGFISWADDERDLSAWLGNEMQRDAFDSLRKMEADIKNLNDKAMLREWRTLQTSDHFYYMSTKRGNDGGVHSYFSPYPSPYEAFINYMNVLTDFTLRIKIQKAAAAIGKKVRTAGIEEAAAVSA
ncbi:MAG TPA: glycoside hydrolase family 57 protein [Chryseosolibacter sp.]